MQLEACPKSFLDDADITPWCLPNFSSHHALLFSAIGDNDKELWWFCPSSSGWARYIARDD